MNCDEVRQLLNPYTDGELDLVRQVEIERHLATCPECVAQEASLRTLRSALASDSLRYRAPLKLRDQIQSASIPELSRARWRQSRNRVMAASILLLVGAIGFIAGQIFHSGTSDRDRIIDDIVAGHIRSLQVEHAIDVASNDRHTVKPWFLGKVDFAPQVADLSEQEFTLAGGRMDYLMDRPVASLVYYRRLHAINVFIWPANQTDDQPAVRFSRQGFHLRNWNSSGMTYWVISDLNDRELDDFVTLYRDQFRNENSRGK